MASSQEPTAKTLFNDPTLSDVKLKQTCNGSTREYFAHKSVLCGQSAYFMKTFCGNFKEAFEGTMELQDDNPEHFEFALRFMYTPEYDHATAEKLAPATDEIKCAAFALGIHTIADKYDINRLISPAVADLRQILLKTTSSQALKSVIKKHYDSCTRTGTPMGKLIVSTVLRKHLVFRQSETFTELLRCTPLLAVDIALDYHHDQLFDVRRIECCGQVNVIGERSKGSASALYCYCPVCRTGKAVASASM